ncbi:hypothetical protein F5148DRAFT_853195 [Russula earlei]|uniref:Uncharacterized protein n=1 Tax=Russula earlei TaxID=71964 RepID=A0ACC0UNA9_9AGAM|nr:hypothetical protein F5148DRAFT_853195 [Russula earlei]
MALLESVPLREWGTRYDSLSTSPSPSAISAVPQPKTGDKLSHEASVFVGSLPTNVEHEELSARLKDHLSIYVDVNLVRIIRDSRGGVCAFVQCDDSTSAAQFLQTVRSQPPQSFMGRHLRFEPARSQRTLWISYRKPIEVICDADRGLSVPSSNSNGRLVEFDLPNVMRISRTPGSRRVTIHYSVQAVHFDGITTTTSTPSHSLQEQDSTNSVLSGVGLVLSPLQFDSQTLHQIASFFGPLESFGQLEHTENARVYSYPHNADRSENMDPGCWEIKWENRTDCLSALATLRSVPHLTVTWPNQQHALIPRRTIAFNRSHHVKDRLTVKPQFDSQQGQPRRGHDHIVTDQVIPPLDPSFARKHSVDTAAASVGSQSSSDPLSTPNNGDLPISSDDWTIVDAGINTDFHVPETFPDAVDSNQLQTSGVRLCDNHQERRGDNVLCTDGLPSSQWSNPLEWSEVVSDRAAHPKVASLSPAFPLHDPAHVENLASPFIPRSPRPVYPSVGNAFNFYDNFAIPPALQWSETRPRRHSEPGDENVDVNPRNVHNQTTIFVGGLEVHGRCTWDEQRLKGVFGQYGEIVEVKLVRPAHRKSAFAFVTYKNAKSSLRAIQAEHDRIYDGRHIRVQLRDSSVQKAHGSKPSFRATEGRTFSPRHQFGPRMNSSPVDTPSHVQNGIGPVMPIPCEEFIPALPHFPNGAASVHPESRGQVPENTCVPLIPSQASSTMVSCVPPITYPPAPPTAFYAPAPWFMHPYTYGPPHIVPGYPPVPLTSVVGANEAGRPLPSNTMYQQMPHYSVYPLPLHPIPPTRQQPVESASVSERRAPLQPTGFIEKGATQERIR